MMPLLLAFFSTVAVAQDATPRHRWGVRLGMSNEGAPVAGGELVWRASRYLEIIPAVESSSGDNGPWIGVDVLFRIPLWSEDHALSIGAGLVSVAGEFRADSDRVIAPEVIAIVGGRGYGYVRTIRTEENRFAVGGGFRF